MVKKKIILGITAIVLIVAIIMLVVFYSNDFFIKENIPEGEITTNLDIKAMEFCKLSNSARVVVCEEPQIIEVVSRFVGGGSTYYDADGNKFICPLVSTEAMSVECKRLFDLKVNESIICKEICEVN
jgi:hypothetical protein